MASAPTLVSYTETAWNTAATSKSTASVSWDADDLLVVIGGTESGTTLGVPTATGLTFTSAVLNTAVSTCGTRGAYAIAGSSGSSAVTMTNSGSFNYGFAVWVWRRAAGIGSNGEQHTTTHTVTVIPADTHSGWCFAAFDFSATAVSNSLTPTVDTEREKAVENGAYTAFVGEIADRESGAATGFGLDAGGTAGTISIVVLEVRGAPMPTVNYALFPKYKLRRN